MLQCPVIVPMQQAVRISRYVKLDLGAHTPDRVFGYAQGAYAEQLVVDPKYIIPIPENVSFEEAAVVPLYVDPPDSCLIGRADARTYTTSYEGLVHRARAQRGELQHDPH